MSTSTVEAAKTLDDELELLRKQTAEGTNFFNILVDEFAGKLDDTNDEHMNDFYLMIPALSLQAVESVVSSREKLVRRGKDDVESFADDGFAFGIAFLLHVLDQGTAFDSLNWRNTVVRFYSDEKAKNTATNKDEDARWSSDDAASDDESSTKTRLGKIQATVDEFALFHFCLGSARTFLKHS
jgi:WASH complex subunit 7